MTITVHEQASQLATAPLLEVRDLHVRFGGIRAVRGVSFDLRRGEVLGIVGESGSGKSVTSNAIMGLHPDHTTITGSIRFEGQELIGLHDRAMSKLRGARISMVFQDPMSSLNPVLTVGAQLIEAIRIHRDVPKAEARREAIELLGVVGMPDAEHRIDHYPHEFSGGMRQRAVIAIAMANRPDVIIADEPTTALDVTVQAQVLEALDQARKHVNAALILVTHDMGVIAGHADRVLVMYGGRVVERGDIDQVFEHSRMPYTRGLLASIPRIDQRDAPLIPIPGAPPSPASLTGRACPFADRCAFARDTCREKEPELLVIDAAVAELDGAQQLSTHAAACHFARQPEIVRAPLPSVPEPVVVVERDAQVLLEVDDLVQRYDRKDRAGKRTSVLAVDGVSFTIREGETLGLVGESGCGKSSAARAITRLQTMTSGTVSVRGSDLASARGRALTAMRRQIQMVFQDPFSSLDPRMSVADLIGEALALARVDRKDRPARVAQLLRDVGLAEEMAERYPHEFSGGQRQRIGIARALATDPDVIVLDEPVSALDVSVQAGIVNLLSRIQAERGLGYLFVAHDLAVVAHISDRIAVMYLGRIVEIGTRDEVFDDPAHPYTKALLSAIPIPDPKVERAREAITLTGDMPSPSDRPSGCAFRARCPIFATLLDDERRERCVSQDPRLEPTSSSRDAACHFPELTRELQHA
ncbi:ABC transporter ATP-binding protein [Agrococcus sp. ARC_14]|uniref:ABC transporter ATP-binding protein n=1 Tax=Agrococcus sp. ARC_14 TaxID=2919927 RepID=UPI001F05F8DC|nr:ABC transporter ATP-binding protein [Agrococcus sp. ARC_14]MCH1883918.1 ABC transporter ATP-binding protein [Agrococcus sp. ARC_14]